MPIRKPRIKLRQDVPPLCVAVQRIREAAGLSQEELGRVTCIASQTLSRFERGVQIPRDLEVLMQLRQFAAGLGLVDEKRLLDSEIRRPRPFLFSIQRHDAIPTAGDPDYADFSYSAHKKRPAP